MTNPVYRTPAWRRASKLTLARDGHWCQIRYPKCKGVATTADHIVELEDGGEVYALENLQAACRSCNTAKRNKALSRRAKRRSNALQPW